MVFLPMRDEWNFVTTESGAQFVMTFGALPMPLLSVDSWDSVILVSRYFTISTINSFNLFVYI